MKLNIGSLVIIFVFAVYFVLRYAVAPWTPAHIIGCSIAVPAFLLVIVARIQLGGAFSVRPRASRLVTTGLYSRIRNPIYIFGSLFGAGLLIWIDRLWFLLFFVVLVPLQIFRSRKEAQVLEEKFGSDYVEYRQKTWF